MARGPSLNRGWRADEHLLLSFFFVAGKKKYDDVLIFEHLSFQIGKGSNDLFLQIVFWRNGGGALKHHLLAWGEHHNFPICFMFTSSFIRKFRLFSPRNSCLSHFPGLVGHHWRFFSCLFNYMAARILEFERSRWKMGLALFCFSGAGRNRRRDFPSIIT